MVVEAAKDEVVGPLLGVVSKHKLATVGLAGEVFKLGLAACLKRLQVVVLSSELDSLPLQISRVSVVQHYFAAGGNESRNHFCTMGQHICLTGSSLWISVSTSCTHSRDFTTSALCLARNHTEPETQLCASQWLSC